MANAPKPAATFPPLLRKLCLRASSPNDGLLALFLQLPSRTSHAYAPARCLQPSSANRQCSGDRRHGHLQWRRRPQTQPRQQQLQQQLCQHWHKPAAQAGTAALAGAYPPQLRQQRQQQQQQKKSCSDGGNGPPSAPVTSGSPLLIEFACEADSTLSATMFEAGGNAGRVHKGSFNVIKNKDVNRLIKIVQKKSRHPRAWLP